MLLKNYASVLILVCGVILTVYASENNKRSELYRRRRQTSIVQDTENVGCQLPTPQQNGLFSPSQRRCPPDNDHPLCQMTPGNRVPQDWVLYHKCDSGYILNNTATTVSVCLNGHWRPVLPRCVKLCPALPSSLPEDVKQDLSSMSLEDVFGIRAQRPLRPSLSVKTKCLFRGREVSCDKEMRPGTVASAECPQFYKSSFEKICLDNGTWMVQNRTLQLVVSDDEEKSQSSFRCIPECGITSKTNTSKTSENPTPAMAGEFPWVAGIYRKRHSKYYLKCAGTLINEHVVITAAGCLFTNKPNRTKMEPGDIRVVLGKLYKDFYMSESSSAIIEVEDMKIHSLYEGSQTFHENNVALLSLMVKVHVSPFIMPVCIDWELNNTRASGTLFESASWTKNHATMMTAQLKLIGHKDCDSHLDSQSKKYLVADMFCIEESQERLYEIYGGTGVTFVKDGRHFFAGIFENLLIIRSLSIELLLITDIWNHVSWLKNTTNLLEKMN